MEDSWRIILRRLSSLIEYVFLRFSVKLSRNAISRHYRSEDSYIAVFGFGNLIYSNIDDPLSAEIGIDNRSPHILLTVPRYRRKTSYLSRRTIKKNTIDAHAEQNVYVRYVRWMDE